MARRSIDGMRGILTGASSGIGRALTLMLAKEGASLVLVARNAEQLASLAGEVARIGGKAQVVVGDICNPNVREQAIQTAVASFGGLDLLINNAGIGALGRFADASPDRLRRIMEVNFFAPAELIRAAIPELRRGRAPLVVNISSILGHRGIPHSSEYCASKFALQGFSESLRSELRRLGIDLLVVSPGTTMTDFFDHNLERQPTPWPPQRGVRAETVARRTVRAMRQGRHEIIVNWRGYLLVLLNRLFPRAADWLLQRYG
jgi:short-subunit dehydrogenase